MNRKTEILAPAGSLECVIAAVRTGADAVYFGTKSLNARRKADNFGNEELKQAIEYCHSRGVRVHITLNTLISDEEMPKWTYLKGSKSEKRTSKEGYEYNYSEGSMAFPDALDKPSRTIITGEGGAAPSRFKHVILTPSGRYRRLMPIELERLNMFPDNHTAGATDMRRAFLMGNALVTGIVERIGIILKERM